MYVICLTSGGYSEDGSLKKKKKKERGKKKSPERQETPASPEVIRFVARKF